MAVKDRPQCFFDIAINNIPAGRIVFELFTDKCYKTCENFRCLCTGERGIGKATQKPLHYKGTTFHRIVKNFMIQGGDISDGNGKGGESIYGGFFADESFELKHDRAFLLSMANRVQPMDHVVFGHVVSGQELVKDIENQKTNASSLPYADICIVCCGEFFTTLKGTIAIRVCMVLFCSSLDLSTSQSYRRKKK
uniref:Peptidyl-prolyl cis-trans isomerase n=1 Tax=Eptatretus burgeri TaxID=7764 RepID=A0A8C4R371_EPTBU